MQCSTIQQHSQTVLLTNSGNQECPTLDVGSCPGGTFGNTTSNQCEPCESILSMPSFITLYTCYPELAVHKPESFPGLNVRKHNYYGNSIIIGIFID